MKSLNENIFHQYNKWKKNYVRKENSIEIKLNEFLSRNPVYINYLSISEDGKCVNCNHKILIYDEDLIDGKFPFPFGTVNGDFNCSVCDELISLEGAPNRVTGDFESYSCPKLTSLVGAPEYVGDSFDCTDCPKLTSLEGAPEKVGKFFDCTKCPNLTSLEHLPKKIGGVLRVDEKFEGKIPSDVEIIMGIQYY